MLPYILGITQRDDRRGLSAGLSVKQPFASGFTASFTVNPDFKTIEDEVESIDFSYTERFISDRRPFFTEGNGFFPYANMFYTRRIEDVDAGVKLFGRSGRAKVGVLNVLDVGRRNDTSARVSYDLTSHSNLWVAGVHTSRIDSSNATVGSGGEYRINTEKGGYRAGFSFIGNVLGSEKGNILTASIGRWAGGTGGAHFHAYFQDVDEGYTNWAAYIPEKSFRKFGFTPGFWRSYDSGPLRYYDVRLSTCRAESHADTLMYQEMDLWTGIGIRKLNGADVSFGLSYGERSPNVDRTARLGLSWNRDDIYQRGSLGVSIGKKAGADYFYLDLNQGYQAAERLNLNIRGELRRMVEPAEGAQYNNLVVLTGNYDVTSEHSIGFRTMYRHRPEGGEENEAESDTDRALLNLCLTYRQTVRAGTDLFLVFGDPNGERLRKRVALKIIRPVF